MSEQNSGSDSLSVIITKLVAVFLGFLVLVLVLVAIGFLGNAYYTARQESQELELIKQEAFVRRQTPEEYLGSELAAENITDEEFEKFMAALRSERIDKTVAGHAAAATVTPTDEAESAMPVIPLIVPESKILPPPDFEVTPADMERLQGKAALIHTTLGTIVVELYTDLAPTIVKNFAYLVENEFYDGLYFHRSLPNTYVQSGSPTGFKGASAGYWFQGSSNDVYPFIGTIAAVPSVDGGDMISGEFVIFCRDGTAYEGQCIVFGRVIDRFDVAEKISDTRWDRNGYAFERTYIKKVDIVDV
ncbi:MAG: peptidylprolyl isomerase, partial [Planctomycetota bacterium]